MFNLLPILPMDGGMVLKRILSDKMGNKGAEKVLKAISMAMISLLAAAEALLLIKNSFNFSLLFVIVFLTANIFTNTEKYSTNLVKELLYIKEKQKKCVVKAEVLLVNDDYPKRKIAESFNASKCYVVLEKSKNGKIKKIFTEEEIIDAILKKS